MNPKSTTYRFFSALVLMLLINSFVLPGGLSAVSLFCDMPMTEMHNSPQNCCDIDKPEETAHHRSNSADEDCHTEKICLHHLSPDQSEVEAVVAQQAKKLLATIHTVEIIRDTDTHSTAEIFSLSSAIPEDPPPIFLLNSTFLN